MTETVEMIGDLIVTDEHEFNTDSDMLFKCESTYQGASFVLKTAGYGADRATAVLDWSARVTGPVRDYCLKEMLNLAKQS